MNFTTWFFTKKTEKCLYWKILWILIRYTQERCNLVLDISHRSLVDSGTFKAFIYRKMKIVVSKRYTSEGGCSDFYCRKLFYFENSLWSLSFVLKIQKSISTCKFCFCNFIDDSFEEIVKILHFQQTIKSLLDCTPKFVCGSFYRSKF